MAKFSVRADIMNICYDSSIGGVLRYCLEAWCGNATKVDIERIDSVIEKKGKVIRIPQPYIDSIYAGLRSIKLSMMWTDTKHPLHAYLHNDII